MDPTALTSDMPVDGVVPKNEPLPVSTFTSDAHSNRHSANGIDSWQYGDHPATDLMVEQRTLPEWSQSGAGQEGAMGERDDRASGGGTEFPRPGQLVAPREGFGEAIAALTVDRTAQTEGNGSRTVTSSLTARGVSSWPTGEDGFAMVQTVNLNLEPADLGPVNVRIFMTDRTVHAHIRTDHMDFGQGMLSQQQQLETKLHSSGLEMGEFKVTVDHHPLSRGDSQNWFGQQADRHPSPVDALPRASEQEAPEAPPVERRRHMGIVSLFA
jgi:Flagellar hook-length control protein FliK